MAECGNKLVDAALGALGMGPAWSLAPGSPTLVEQDAQTRYNTAQCLREVVPTIAELVLGWGVQWAPDRLALVLSQVDAAKEAGERLATRCLEKL